MHFQVDLLTSIIALGACAVLFVVCFVFKTVLESRRIERFCISLSGSINTLKQHNTLKGVAEMSESEKKSFNEIQQAFNSYIKNNSKYKMKLLNMMNEICGTSYSLYDMYDCFENKKVNSFFRDIVKQSGFLFINVVYMSCLESNGFYVQDGQSIGKYL